MSRMIQVGRHSVIERAGTEGDWLASRQHFKTHGWVLIPELFDLEFLKQMIGPKLQCDWRRYGDAHGSEWEAQQKGWVQALLFCLNQPKLLEWIATLTQTLKLKSFQGRLYALEAKKGDQMDWHDDCLQGRLLAMSLNLSEGAYLGGELMIRKKRKPLDMASIQNNQWGQVLLFGIGKDREHCVQPVLGSVSKVSLAGWFLRRASIFMPMRKTLHV